ncbi:hypothetical protein MMC07_004582 [Pseudocyphellaria aurata]|nr:hypothetical protein [Pseudocyphellaria aurata]
MESLAYNLVGDLKTEIQMIKHAKQQSDGEATIRSLPAHLSWPPDLALWHLRFNYLKMVWEVFYPGNSTNEQSTLQWAADHWRQDKTTKPADFHSLEDLTIHSYRARIIAIMRSWIHEHAPEYDSKDSAVIGAWLSGLSRAQWDEALEWLDGRINQDQEPGLKDGNTVNDHWTNHVRFCSVMEPYLTLCCAIKHGDTGLLRTAIREVCIVMPAPSASKPKYAKALLRQVHIIETTAADPTLQEAYLANTLVNLRGLPHTFYEMDLLLEHQNGEFKQFRMDRGSSLQESDDLFRQHALTAKSLQTMRLSSNKTLVGRHRDGRHPAKDAGFDIRSLADQLYHSRSAHPSGPDSSKPYYFSENKAPNLINEGREYLITHSDTLVQRDATTEDISSTDQPEDQQFPELDGCNEVVNELFSIEREEALVTLDLPE